MGRKFKKGESGNPNGRPRLPPHIRALKSLNHETISNLVAQMQSLEIEELVAIAKNPKSPGLQAAFASVIVHAIKQGDMGRLDRLLDRGAGRVKQVVLVERQEIGTFDFTEDENED